MADLEVRTGTHSTVIALHPRARSVIRRHERRIDQVVRAAHHVMEILDRRPPAAEAAVQGLRQGIRDIEEGNALVKKRALYPLGERCHPNALGDLYLRGISQEEWPKQLEHVHDACAEAFNRLDKDGV